MNHQDFETTVRILYLMCTSISPHIALGSSQAPGSSGPKIGSIQTEYHPNSGQSTKIKSLEDYFEHTSKLVSPPEDSEPWWPFHSQADFEFAKLALKAALRKVKLNSLYNFLENVLKARICST